MASIFVTHNIEVAHRLSELPGKCQNIHGHSMEVTLYLHGDLNSKGVLEGLDFGTIKKEFRHLLDNLYDHHLILNRLDPWARPILMYEGGDSEPITDLEGHVQHFLPGLIMVEGDPTTENLCKWIFRQMCETGFGVFVNEVSITETCTNGASWSRADEDL